MQRGQQSAALGGQAATRVEFFIAQDFPRYGLALDKVHHIGFANAVIFVANEADFRHRDPSLSGGMIMAASLLSAGHFARSAPRADFAAAHKPYRRKQMSSFLGCTAERRFKCSMGASNRRAYVGQPLFKLVLKASMPRTLPLERRLSKLSFRVPLALKGHVESSHKEL